MSDAIVFFAALTMLGLIMVGCGRLLRAIRTRDDAGKYSRYFDDK